MKLYKVCSPGKRVQFFDKKVEAKVARDATPGSTLHRGPDHGRGETDGSYTLTPTSKSGW